MRYIILMNTITIPKKVTAQGDLVILPRKELEALLKCHTSIKFSPTVSQKKALARAEKNFQHKKTLSFHELAETLGLAN